MHEDFPKLLTKAELRQAAPKAGCDILGAPNFECRTGDDENAGFVGIADGVA
jgi:hypothetical protein